MRKISLLHQSPGRHGPRHWLSGLLTLLVCLINVFSIVGLSFSSPTSHAASLVHSTPSAQSASQVSQNGLQAQVSTLNIPQHHTQPQVSTQKTPQHHMQTQTPAQKTPQHHMQTQTPAQKAISPENNSAPLRRLKPHVHQDGVGSIPDLSITKTVSPTSARSIGDTILYTLTITNFGAAVNFGTDITVTDPIAVGLSNVTPSGSGWLFSPTNSPLTSPVTITATYKGGIAAATTNGTIVPSAALPSILITGTVNTLALTSTSQSSTFSNTATVTTAEDNTTSNHLGTKSAEVDFTVLRPDLGLTVTNNTEGPCISIGNTATYTLTVTNNAAAGSYTTGTIIINGTIPAALDNVVINYDANWAIITGTASFSATYIGTLPITAGTSLTSLTITGTINNTADTTLVNAATLTDDPLDNTTTDKTPSTGNTITVCPRPDLGLVITDNSNSSCIPIGNTATYTFTATNNAAAGSYPTTATGPITITGTLPAGLSSPTNLSKEDWSITLGATSFSATYIGKALPLAAGDSLNPLIISSTISNPTGATLVTTATLADDPLDNTTTDKTNMTDTITACNADLGLVITDNNNSGCIRVGNTATYTLTVTNNDNTNATSYTGPITINGTLPAALNNPTITNASGTNWTVTFIPGTTTFSATYIASDNIGGGKVTTDTIDALREGTPLAPIPAGTVLTPLIISGTINNSASATLVTTATLLDDTTQDFTTNDKHGTDTINVCRADLTISQTHSPTTSSFLAGQSISYTVTVSNTGPNASVIPAGEIITVTDILPTGLTGLTLNGTGWTFSRVTIPLTATYTVSTPILQNGMLPPITIMGTLTTGSVGTTITNTATASTPLDVLTAGETEQISTDTITGVAAPDLAITNTHTSNAPFVTGQTIIYTLGITNVSTIPVAAGNPITVVDTLPVGLTNAWALGSNWSLIITNGILNGTYTGSYPVATGALPSITIYGTLTNPIGATISNIATVTTPADSNLANNTATDTFTVTTLPNTLAPDLSISFSHAGSACVANNDIVTYTLSVTNAATAGPIYAGQPIIVNATLPTNMTGITPSTSGNWQLSYSGNIVIGIYNAPVASGGILPAITITGNLTTVNSATLTSTATVILANDSTTANNSATDLLTTCTPDLAIVKTHLGSGPFRMGTAVTFNLAVSNVGTAPIMSGQAITVIDAVPSGISSITATGGTDWTVTTVNNTVTANYIGTYPVAPAASLTPILVSGQISSLDQPTLTNSATMSTPGDVKLKNNVSTDTIRTPAYPNLSVRIGKPNCANKHDQASFIFTVRTDANADPAPASAPITLTFRDPIGLDQISYSGSNWTWHKDGSVITATYVHTQSIDPGSTLDTFTITGTVTKSHAENIWVGVRVYEHNDPDFNNDTAEDTLKVC